MTDNGILVMLYLYHVDGLAYSAIAEKLKEIEHRPYKESTIRQYVKHTYANRINEAKAMFAEKPSSRRQTSIITETSICWGNVVIKYEKTVNEQDTGKQGQKCYLFKFYDSKNRPIFTKIGTTINSALSRLKQEISYYQKHGVEDIAKVKICGIIDCGDTPAEGYESYLRACFIRDYPEAFHKNDRFFNLDIPTEYFFTCCEHYNSNPTPYQITL